jgi:asparagine synthase (glutamine-hydrolysing)
MSILGGILAERTRVASRADLYRLVNPTERYATAPAAFYKGERLGMSVQPYASHARSAMDATPKEDSEGNVVSFDGRLDNYSSLADELGLNAAIAGDSDLVLAALARWGENCFTRFTGDWAVAMWSQKRQRLYLARDHAGTRTLYFTRRDNKVWWSTYLDPLVITGSEPKLSEAYVARYLAQLPLRELTPYDGVVSVLPGHFVIFAGDAVLSRRHWSALVQKRIEYRSEAEYDEQFRFLLRQAVLRRTGPGTPILAQLSGGMDSTSIVCMSDSIRRSGDPDAAILDTISYFDDSEQTLDERAYFSITERFRGKVGTHVEVSSRHRTFQPHDRALGRYLVPGADSSAFRQEETFSDTVWKRGYRSILSGIGGDEVLGGNPIGAPELGDYLLSFRWSRLLRQAVAWSLTDRTTLAATLARSAACATRSLARRELIERKPVPWISTALAGSSDLLNASPDEVIPLRWGSPSQWDNATSWWTIMETLPHRFPRILHRVEYRYPLLDKDLVEFAFSIPRSQILRPGRRRLLMRRALRTIVPVEILERRQKAYQLHAPLSALRGADRRLRELFSDSSQLVQRGFIKPEKIREGLDRIGRGDAEDWQAMMRAIALELWLRSDSGCPEYVGHQATKASATTTPATMSSTAG